MTAAGIVLVITLSICLLGHIGTTHKVTIYRAVKPSRLFLSRVLFSDFYHGGACAQTLPREEGWEYFIFV